MEACKKLVIVALVLAFALVADGQSICGVDKDGLDACKPSVSGKNPTPPSAACCSALSKADLPCLCTYKKSPLLAAYGININLALQLPTKCGLQAPTC